MAKAYLNSIDKDKDAMIFTIGDNDTFALWYAQEIENYRTDIFSESIFFNEFDIEYKLRPIKIENT